MWPELWLQTSVYGPSFGNDFMNLTSMDEVQNRRTIRVILLCCNRPSIASTVHEDSSSLSSGCVDMDILSSPESDSVGSETFWPSSFSVPRFCFDAELKLEGAKS